MDILACPARRLPLLPSRTDFGAARSKPTPVGFRDRRYHRAASAASANTALLSSYRAPIMSSLWFIASIVKPYLNHPEPETPGSYGSQEVVPRPSSISFALLVSFTTTPTCSHGFQLPSTAIMTFDGSSPLVPDPFLLEKHLHLRWFLDWDISLSYSDLSRARCGLTTLAFRVQRIDNQPICWDQETSPNVSVCFL